MNEEFVTNQYKGLVLLWQADELTLREFLIAVGELETLLSRKNTV